MIKVIHDRNGCVSVENFYALQAINFIRNTGHSFLQPIEDEFNVEQMLNHAKEWAAYRGFDIKIERKGNYYEISEVIK